MVLVANILQAQTLEECRKMAHENYPQIKQYNLILQTEQYNISNAAKAWIPQVVFSGQASWQTAAPTYPQAFNDMLAAYGANMKGIDKDQYKVAVDISQNIWDGGYSSAKKEIAKADAREQNSSIDVALYDLQTRVDNIYFGILLLDERKAQTTTLIEVLESNFARMQSYCRNGVATQSDVDAIEAEILSAKQTLEQIKTSGESYRRVLELFIGEPLKETKLALPEASMPQSYNSARPELDLFEAQSNKVSAQRKELESSIKPHFSAFAQGYYGYPGMDMFKSMVSSEWTPNAILGIRMQWNIGAFYTRKNNLKKLDIAQQQIAVQKDIFLFNTQLQSIQDDGEIARLRSTLESDNQIVKLRRSVRKAAESKLENGVIDSTDLLRKIADETTAQLNRSTHEIELLQAIYRLKNTLNQ